MKTLLLLRHAKSSWDRPDQSDHDRPLNSRGKHDAPRMGKLMRQQDIVPDLIVSSTARRAIDTANAAADGCGYERDSVMTTRLLYHAGVEEYIEVLQDLGEGPDRVMAVGHNPGIAELVEALTDEFARMPTAALAQIELPINAWSELREDTGGKLAGYWEPRNIGPMI
jgi:phosphohistidine phosphatase